MAKANPYFHAGLGRLAYVAYCEGYPGGFPAWETLDEHIRLAWCSAAAAVAVSIEPRESQIQIGPCSGPCHEPQSSWDDYEARTRRGFVLAVVAVAMSLVSLVATVIKIIYN